MPTEDFQPHQLIAGRYRLGELLGRGGMALVYRASDQNLERDVAVKFIRPELASDFAARRRFSREAQSAGGLNHPNIVAVYDTGSFTPVGGDPKLKIPFIVMELVEGQTIQELMLERRVAAGLSPSPDETPQRDSVGSSPETDDSADAPDHQSTPTTETGTDTGTEENDDKPQLDANTTIVSSGAAHITDTLDDPEHVATPTEASASETNDSSSGENDTESTAKPDQEHKPERPPTAAMPQAEAVDIACEVLSALAYSHERGIVHRDIKPGNIMVNERGDVKVMDFGIARAMSDTASTQTQHPVGTPHYISPEQAQAHPADHRSDIYSAACLFYELLTGVTPFRGDTPVAITYQHVEKAPTLPSNVSADIPKAFDAVIERAMAKSADDRYQSADDFLRELKQAAESSDDGDSSSAPSGVGKSQQQSGVIILRPDVDPETPTDSKVGTDTAEITETVPRKRYFAFGALALASIAAIAMLVLAFTHLLNDSQSETDSLMVATPQVLQLDKAVAQEKIESVGLIFRESEQEYSDTPEGTVLSISPVPGVKIKPGSIVKVVVSRGPERARIPSVLGYAKDAARTTLIDAGFVIEKVEQVDDPEAPAGSVVSLEPEMGSTHSKGTKVTVRVCSGYITLPDVAGKTLAEAQSTLKNMKLETIVSEEASWSQSPGTIIRHSPAAGRIRQHSTVGLVVAKRPAPRPEKTTPTATPTEPGKTPPGEPSKTKPPANRVTPKPTQKDPNKPGQPTETLD